MNLFQNYMEKFYHADEPFFFKILLKSSIALFFLQKLEKLKKISTDQKIQSCRVLNRQCIKW